MSGYIKSGDIRGDITYEVYETQGVPFTALVLGNYGIVEIYAGDLADAFEANGRAAVADLEPVIDFDFDEWAVEPCFDCDYDAKGQLVAHADDCYWKANPDALTSEKAQSVAEQAVLQAAGRIS
jgi:hypothetical protein